MNKKWYGSPYKTLKQNSGKLTKRQYQQLKGQVKNGHPDDAMRGLERLLQKKKEEGAT